jgi:hypothetical protein
MTFEIEKTFVASTVHIEEEDISLLHLDNEWRLNNYEYGLLIYIGDDEAMNNFSSNYSEGLKLLVLFAISLDCKYLKLDSDGPVYDKFPEYEW